MVRPISSFYAPPESIEFLCDNDQKAVDAVRVFAEIETCDPRLMLVIAAARIDLAMMELCDTQVKRTGNRPYCLRTRTLVALQHGLIEPEYHRFIEALRTIRNMIAHRHTDRFSLLADPQLPVVERMHELAADVPVWDGGPVEPTRDLNQSVFAFCLSGVLAAELSFFDEAEKLIPKGFGLVRRYADCGPVIANEETED